MGWKKGRSPGPGQRVQMSVSDRPPLRSRETRDLPDYVELWTHPFRAWDPGMLLRAKSMADEGNLELVGDLCESAMADDRVSAALEQRVQGLEGLALTFKGGTDLVRDALDIDFWRMSSPGLRKKIRAWGLLAGVCPVYVREWRTLGGREVPILKFWHPRWLRWRNDEQEWYIQTRSGLVRLSSQPGRWYLYCPQSEEDSRPWVDGLWYSIATWWLSKSFAIADLANFGQAHATPKAILKGESNSARQNGEDKDEAISHLYRLANRSAVYVPPGFDLSMWETNSYAWQSYKTALDFANRALASRILGQHLTTDEAGGAGAVMDDELRLDLIKADADAESAFYHDQILRDWYGVNFVGFEEETDDEDPVPWLQRNVTPPEDKAQLADTSLKAAQAVQVLITASVASPEQNLLEGVDLGAFLRRFFPETDKDPGGGDVPEAYTAPSVLPTPPVGALLLEAKEVTDFPSKGEDKAVSLANSSYPVFDPSYADKLKEDWPEIWNAGGNDNPETEHSGDDQWRRLRPQVGRNPKTPTEEEAVRRREAWAARHAANKRLAGVIALVKWLVVGDIGEAGMKEVIEAEKDRLREKVEASAPSLMFRAARQDPRRHLQDGTAYTVDLSAQMAAQTSSVMEGIVGEVVRVLASARGYEDARRRLTEAFPQLPREELRTLLTQGMLLAGGAGLLSAGREGRE